MFKKFYNSYLAYVLVYTFYFLSFALFSSLISVYMLGLGFSAGHTSVVVSVAFFASMLAQPVMGILNDRLSIKKVTLFSFGAIIFIAIYFMQVRDLLGLTIGYSLVIMLINGVNPVMDVLAARSPYTYGKIRIWGTIGYALGSQLAGVLYQYVSPMAIFIAFIGAMIITIVGVLSIKIRSESPKSDEAPKTKKDSYISQILTNKTYLYYLLIVALYSGVGNAGHTYIPAMLQHSGLSVGMASTVVSISVICESPLIFYSYLFMDKLSAKKLLLCPLLIMLVQYTIYGLNLGLASKIILTLASKHVSGMLLIMVTLKIVSAIVDSKYLVTAIALVQTVRSLGSIFIQHFAGAVIDAAGYETMSFFLAGLMVLVIALAWFLKVPEKEDQKLFS